MYNLCGIEGGISHVGISYTCINMVTYTFTPINSLKYIY